MKTLAPQLIALLVLTSFLQIQSPAAIAEEGKSLNYQTDLLKAEKDAVKNDAVRSEDHSSGEYLDLEDCIAIALEKNFRIMEAQERIKAQSGIELQAKAIMYLKLRALADYNKIEQDRLANFDGRIFGADEGWRGDFEIEQPVFLGGEGLAARREQSFRSKAAEFALLAVVNRVFSEVRVRFYDVLLARSRITVREEAVKLLQEELQAEKNRLEVGTVSQFNVLRAEVELANAKTPLIQARNDFRISLEELNRILAVKNQHAGEILPSIRIQGKLEFTEPELDLPGTLAKARKQRPEIEQLKLLVQASEQGVKLARSDFFPELIAFAGYGGESSRFDNDLSDVDHGWEYGLRLDWNIFDSGASIGRVTEALSIKRQREIALSQELLNIDIEVRRAMSRLVEARELVLASRKVIKQAEESLRLARARLEAGSGRQLDVLDTRVSLTEAQTNQIDSLHSFNVALAELDRAVGIPPK